jgi:ubiquinone/menaquinone biosynthesis C-methylase UbiE
MSAVPTHASSELARAQFGAVADTYATSSVHARGPDLQALVAAASPNPTDEVLDLACGAGHTALAVAPHVAHVTAVDVTPDMLATAARLVAQRGVSNIAFERADASALPFADARFDLVTSRLAAHHFADPSRALAEVLRVLKPGGRFVLVDAISPEDAPQDTFLNCFELLRDASHVRDWRISEWLRLMMEAGFQEPSLLETFTFDLDGDEWVQRMRTPPSKVAMIRQLFAEASPAQQREFDIRTDEKWGFKLGVALLRATC